MVPSGPVRSAVRPAEPRALERERDGQGRDSPDEGRDHGAADDRPAARSGSRDALAGTVERGRGNERGADVDAGRRRPGAVARHRYARETEEIRGQGGVEERRDLSGEEERRGGGRSGGRRSGERRAPAAARRRRDPADARREDRQSRASVADAGNDVGSRDGVAALASPSQVFGPWPAE